MLDIEVRVRQVEVRLVLAALCVGRRVRVMGLVLVADAVKAEEVGDFRLLEALHGLAVETDHLDRREVVKVVALGHELEGAAVGGEVALNIAAHGVCGRRIAHGLPKQGLDVLVALALAVGPGR